MKFEDACKALPNSSVVGGQLIAYHLGKPIVVGTHLNGQLMPDTSVEALELLANIAAAKSAAHESDVEEAVADAARPKKGRRTKAQIEADRVAAEEAGNPPPEDEVADEDGDPEEVTGE